MEGWGVGSRGRPSAEFQGFLDRHGVPSSPYRTVREAMDDPQLAPRGSFAEIHDGGGTFRALNPPFRLSNADAVARPVVPALGEHSRAGRTESGPTRTEARDSG